MTDNTNIISINPTPVPVVIPFGKTGYEIYWVGISGGVESLHQLMRPDVQRRLKNNLALNMCGITPGRVVAAISRVMPSYKTLLDLIQAVELDDGQPLLELQRDNSILPIGYRYEPRVDKSTGRRRTALTALWHPFTVDGTGPMVNRIHYAGFGRSMPARLGRDLGLSPDGRHDQYVDYDISKGMGECLSVKGNMVKGFPLITDRHYVLQHTDGVPSCSSLCEENGGKRQESRTVGCIYTNPDSVVMVDAHNAAALVIDNGGWNSKRMIPNELVRSFRYTWGDGGLHRLVAEDAYRQYRTWVMPVIAQPRLHVKTVQERQPSRKFWHIAEAPMRAAAATPTRPEGDGCDVVPLFPEKTGGVQKAGSTPSSEGPQ